MCNLFNYVDHGAPFQESHLKYGLVNLGLFY